MEPQSLNYIPIATIKLEHRLCATPENISVFFKEVSDQGTVSLIGIIHKSCFSIYEARILNGEAPSFDQINTMSVPKTPGLGPISSKTIILTV